MMQTKNRANELSLLLFIVIIKIVLKMLTELLSSLYAYLNDSLISKTQTFVQVESNTNANTLYFYAESTWNITLDYTN